MNDSLFCVFGQITALSEVGKVMKYWLKMQLFCLTELIPGLSYQKEHEKQFQIKHKSKNQVSPV